METGCSAQKMRYLPRLLKRYPYVPLERLRDANPRGPLASVTLCSSLFVATMSQFSLPEEGLLLILGIDTFLDMGRSATNVIGNSLATAVVAKWEGQLVLDQDDVETIDDMEAIGAVHP